MTAGGTGPAGSLQARGVRRMYRRHRGPEVVHALAGVDLTVAEGERVGIVGASGSGKSTLLRLLLALEPVDAGEITYAARPIRPGGVRELRWYRRQVQYVPQDPAGSLDPRRRVADLVAEPLRRLRVDGDHRARAAEVLIAVGLEAGFLDRRPYQLSGGQCQRVAIARALAPGARMILADEPVSGLDLPLRQQVLAVLDEVCRTVGTGLVIVTHDLSVVSRLCDRGVVMDGGRIVEDAATADLLTRPAHPATRRLLDSIPRLLTA
ncbi:ABC transporter ATP-binding protein [Nakamurella sp.]|uniref:ABC transporter ATP-binding protein n=1 Tax=Nakamurella sp. TaxID=1869182 RepID=UPI003783E300